MKLLCLLKDCKKENELLEIELAQLEKNQSRLIALNEK